MKKVFVLLFLTSVLNLFAQNLVQNPSFETVNLSSDRGNCSFCATGAEFNTIVKNWKSAVSRSPDILPLRKCREVNNIPLIAPRTGKYMAGFIAYFPSMDSGEPNDYHEIIEGSLIKPLEIGKKYTFEFYLHSNDSLGALHLLKAIGTKKENLIPVFCNNIGVQFRETPLDINGDWNEKLMVEASTFLKKEVVKITEGWVKLEFTMVAEKPFHYFYIGAFGNDKLSKTSLSEGFEIKLNKTNSERDRKPWQKQKRIAYYCIDDVSMVEEGGKANIFSEKNSYTFKNVTFELGKANLLKNTCAELDLLYEYLQTNTSINITIQGHTDNSGSKDSNLKLSEQRALMVKNYLVQKGIVANRIQTKGFGSEKSIASNKTEKGKAQNRRVEVVFK